MPPVGLHRVTVVTFYTAQLAAISSALAVASLPCAVATVDSMQGSENDVIILSAVRTGATGFGFLTDMQRLNVAISRCRELLVFVCHPRILDALSIGRAFSSCGADFHPSWPSIRLALTTGEGHGTMEGAASVVLATPAALVRARATLDAPLAGLLSDPSLAIQLALSRPTPLMALAAAAVTDISSILPCVTDISTFDEYGASPHSLQKRIRLTAWVEWAPGQLYSRGGAE